MGMISVTGPTKIDVADAAKYYPIPCPSNATIKRLRITNAGAGWKARFYSRKFTTLPIQIALLDKAGTRVQVHTAVRHEFKVGDPVYIDSTSVPSYNAVSHTVREVVDWNTVILETPYVQDGVSGMGTIELRIQSGDYDVWEALNEISVASGVASYDGSYPYRCNDAQSNIGDQRLIYVKFSGTGSYLVAISAESHAY